MKQAEKPAITVSGLHKRFGRKAALDGMQFSVPLGSVAGFLGPNGAGKTTTLRVLLGLARADAGQMQVLGQDMPGGRSAILEQTGTLVEKPSFIEHLSGFDNLWWFGTLNQPVSQERILQVLGQVGLSDAAHQTFGTYSTGMKQRLGVGFALLHRPTLMILDEPTNGMDPQGRVQMRDILREINHTEGTTIFLSSHLLDEIQRLCDYVVIVDRGRTVREGFVAQLLNREEEIWEIRLTEAADLSQVQTFLASQPMVLSCRPAPRGLEMHLKPNSSAEINRLLNQAGHPVAALIPHEASLEETFLSLTDNHGQETAP
jgi:ABC-2 type transport system ATP-binding protein